MYRLPALLLAAALLAASTARAELSFADCRLTTPGTVLEFEAECASLTVAEDHGNPGSRSLSLRIARVAASRPRLRVDDPLYLLAGGPGQAATEAWPILAMALRDISRHREVILVDQRGTGGSNRLDCPIENDPAELETSFDPEVVRRQARECLAGLGVDPRFYTSTQAADDIEVVRRALGHGPINLLGVSYGTRLAQVFLRRYPDSVRRVILDGVVPPGLLLGTEHAPNLDAALQRVLTRCAEDEHCAMRFGDSSALLARLRGRLAEEAPKIRLRLPRSGAFEQVSVTREALAFSLRMLSYAGETQALVPLVLDAADRGDWQPLLTQALLLGENLQTQLARGLELAVTCSEDVPFFPEDLDQSQTLLGNLVVDVLRAQCRDWPAAAVSETFHLPQIHDLPAVLLSGELDPVTPPSYGAETLQQFPRGAHWVVAGAAHGVLRHGCVTELLGRFLDGEEPREMNTACLDEIRPPPFFVDLTGPRP